jgi:hypothetical protein
MLLLLLLLLHLHATSASTATIAAKNQRYSHSFPYLAERSMSHAWMAMMATAR